MSFVHHITTITFVLKQKKMKSYLLIAILCLSISAEAQFQPGKYQSIFGISALDPDSGPEVTYSISAGNTGKYFIIMPCSGIVKVDTAAYSSFTTQRTWNLKLKAADPEGNFEKKTWKVMLRKTKQGLKLDPVIVNPS